MKYLLYSLPCLLLVAGGCTATSGLQDPVAHVVAVKLVEQTQQGARVEVTVTLDNFNNIPLPLTESHYTVSVTGGGVYSANDLPDRTLPASGHQEIIIPAVFATTQKLDGADYAVHGSVAYRPPGEIRKLLTDSWIPLPTASFSSSGKLE